MNEPNRNDGAIVAVDNSYTIIPRNAQAQIAQAKQMLALNTQLLKEVLTEKVDYDRIPGTDKPTLLKPGAEMLCKVYGLTVADQRVTDKTEDWEHGIFSYVVTVTLIHIASGRTVSGGYRLGELAGGQVPLRYGERRGRQENLREQ